MADESPPGILCQVRNPVKIDAGTMCAQKTPKPGITGDRGFWGSAWDDAAWLGGLAVDGAVGTYHGAVWLGREVVGGVEWSASELWSGTKWAASEVWSGAEWAGVEIASGVKRSLGEIRGGAVWLGDKVYDAYKYLRTLFLKILHAANWNILKEIAEPILGPTFMQAGVLWGIVESLGKDILSLLELGKMVVLAGCYELLIHPDIATTLALNPTTLPMVLTALAMKAVAHEIPELAAQMKKSDEQLKKMITDLWKVVSNWNDFLGFVKALGKQLKQGTIDDFNKLKYNAEHRTLANDFETGRIFGRALYQVVMLILMFIGGVAAVRSAVRFLAEVPALLRTAKIIKYGGAVEDIIETEKIAQGTRTVEELEDAANASKTLKPVARSYGKNTATWYQDAQGRTVRVEAKLRESFTGLNRSSAEAKAQKLAAAAGEDGDAGGHMVGHRFMGDQGEINLFPQEGNFNNSAYKTMENELADWTKNGKQVDAVFELDPPGAVRPDSVMVQYTVTDPATGKVVYQNTREFMNEAGQVFDRVKAADMVNYK